MKILLALVAVIAMASPTQAGELDDVTFDQVFPPEAQSKMGLDKLSAEEKKLLKEFVVQKVVAAYVGGQLSIEQETAVGREPKVEERPRSTGGRADPPIGTGHWVDKVIDNGEFVRLEDGSLWEIDALDRINTILWLSLDDVTILESSNCIRGYLLVNTDEGEKACAKLVTHP